MEEIEAWVARDKNERLYLYRNKPYKDTEYWTPDDLGYMRLPNKMFSEIKWSNIEPTKVKLIIEK